MVGSEVLCWRTEYVTGGGAIRYVEWFCATQYGIGHFRIRRQGTQRPTIESWTQIKQIGWLKTEGMNAVNRHMMLNKMRMRAEKEGARIVAQHQPNIETLEKTWLLGQLFQNDTRAHNAWCNLTGIPVGQTFEQIAAQAESLVAQQKEDRRIEKVKALATVDDTWGMF